MKSRPKVQPVNQEEDEEDVEGQEEEDDDDDVDTSCGIGPCTRLRFLSKYFANKNTFIFVYGVLGCIYGSTYAYSNATLSTIEKRFKIPSKVTGTVKTILCMLITSCSSAVVLLCTHVSSLEKRYTHKMGNNFYHNCKGEKSYTNQEFLYNRSKGIYLAS